MTHTGFTTQTRTWLIALVFAVLAFGSQPAIAAEDGKLDDAGLKTMLENLGFEPTEGKYTSGRTYFRLKRKGHNVTLTMDIYLGNNNQMLWTYAVYWTLKDGQTFPQHVLHEAMLENDKTRYVHFALHKNGKQFTLSGSLANNHIKPADLRKMIDEMLTISDRTRHLWNPNYWKKNASAEKTAAEEKPEKGTKTEDDKKTEKK